MNDARLWQILIRLWVILTVGVLGLMLGLGPRPARIDSLFGLLVVVLVVLPIVAVLLRMPVNARKALRELPRRRPMLALTSGLLCGVTALVLGWTIVNTVAPGTKTPLALALLGVVAAGLAVLVGSRLARR